MSQECERKHRAHTIPIGATGWVSLGQYQLPVVVAVGPNSSEVVMLDKVWPAKDKENDPAVLPVTAKVM